jgi:hypothetical protein
MAPQAAVTRRTDVEKKTLKRKGRLRRPEFQLVSPRVALTVDAAEPVLELFAASVIRCRDHLAPVKQFPVMSRRDRRCGRRRSCHHAPRYRASGSPPSEKRGTAREKLLALPAWAPATGQVPTDAREAERLSQALPAL